VGKYALLSGQWRMQAYEAEISYSGAVRNYVEKDEP